MSTGRNTRKAFSLIELSIVVVIIGILIVGITQGSRLLQASRISSAQSLTKGSPIASIPGLMAWFETSGGLDTAVLETDENGFEPEDGDEIITWVDVNPQLTMKKRLTSSADAYPTYVESGINSLPSLRFDGTDDVLFSVANLPISTGDDTYTIVAVFAPDAAVAGNRAVVAQNPADDETADQSAILRIAADNVVFEGSSSENSNSVTFASDVRGTPAVVVVRVDNDATDTVTAYINSNYAITAASAAGTKANLNLASDSFAVGASNFTAGTSAEFFSGLISEVAVFDRALKRSEILAINKYLSQKYSVKLQEE